MPVPRSYFKRSRSNAAQTRYGARFPRKKCLSDEERFGKIAYIDAIEIEHSIVDCGIGNLQKPTEAMTVRNRELNRAELLGFPVVEHFGVHRARMPEGLQRGNDDCEEAEPLLELRRLHSRYPARDSDTRFVDEILAVYAAHVDSPFGCRCDNPYGSFEIERNFQRSSQFVKRTERNDAERNVTLDCTGDAADDRTVAARADKAPCVFSDAAWIGRFHKIDPGIAQCSAERRRRFTAPARVLVENELR